jgi:hypothetical protein
LEWTVNVAEFDRVARLKWETGRLRAGNATGSHVLLFDARQSKALSGAGWRREDRPLPPFAGAVGKAVNVLILPG